MGHRVVRGDDAIERLQQRRRVLNVIQSFSEIQYVHAVRRLDFRQLVAGVALQIHELHARVGEQRREFARWDRTQVAARLGGAAAPRDTDAISAAGIIEPRAPLRGACGIGAQIAAIRRKVSNVPPQKTRQAADRNLLPDLRVLGEPAAIAVTRGAMYQSFRKRACEQSRQPHIAFDDAGDAARQQIRHARGEHHFIAQPLLAVNQQGSTGGQFPSLPCRIRKNARRGAAPARVAHFVIVPPARVVAVAEQGDSAVPAIFAFSRKRGNQFRVMGKCRVNLPLLIQCKPEVGLRCNGGRVEFDGALKIALRTARIAEMAQIRQAQVGACSRVTGLELECALIRRNRTLDVTATAVDQRRLEMHFRIAWRNPQRVLNMRERGGGRACLALQARQAQPRSRAIRGMCKSHFIAIARVLTLIEREVRGGLLGPRHGIVRAQIGCLAYGKQCGLMAIQCA